MSLLGGSIARADDTVHRRRRIGTKLAYAGLAGTLAGIGVGAFAIGLGNDRPDAARPFFAVAYTSLGLGVVGLSAGLVLRASTPAEPDAISLDPVRARHRNERRAGLALMGLGGAVLATGIAHAVGAWRDNQLAQPECPDHVCTDHGLRYLKRAHTLALAADMLVGTGAMGLAGGVILYRGGRDTARIVPTVGAHDAGAAVVGSF